MARNFIELNDVDMPDAHDDRAVDLQLTNTHPASTTPEVARFMSSFNQSHTTMLPFDETMLARRGPAPIHTAQLATPPLLRSTYGSRKSGRRSKNSLRSETSECVRL